MLQLKRNEYAGTLIVFLPVILGFFLTAGYSLLFRGGFVFDQTFVTQWVTSGSLSLTFYAVFEKMFPGKKRGSAGEAEAGVTGAAGETEGNEAGEQKVGQTAGQAAQKTAVRKIILKGKRDEKAETEG